MWPLGCLPLPNSVICFLQRQPEQLEQLPQHEDEAELYGDGEGVVVVDAAEEEEGRAQVVDQAQQKRHRQAK